MGPPHDAPILQHPPKLFPIPTPIPIPSPPTPQQRRATRHHQIPTAAAVAAQQAPKIHAHRRDIPIPMSILGLSHVKVHLPPAVLPRRRPADEVVSLAQQLVQRRGEGRVKVHHAAHVDGEVVGVVVVVHVCCCVGVHGETIATAVGVGVVAW